VRYTPIRNISEEEKRELYDVLDNNPDIKYRAKIILLAGEEGYTVPEIREMTDIYDKTIRKWIHRFNDYGVKGIFTQMDYSGMIKITDKAKNEILRISSTNPREIGLKFSTWSLRSIAGYVKEKKLIKEDGGISHTAIRDILIEYGVEWRHSKTVLGKSKDSDYDLKKAHWGAEE
jgi:transposase